MFGVDRNEWVAWGGRGWGQAGLFVSVLVGSGRDSATITTTATNTSHLTTTFNCYQHHHQQSRLKNLPWAGYEGGRALSYNDAVSILKGEHSGAINHSDGRGDSAANILWHAASAEHFMSYTGVDGEQHLATYPTLAFIQVGVRNCCMTVEIKVHFFRIFVVQERLNRMFEACIIWKGGLLGCETVSTGGVDACAVGDWLTLYFLNPNNWPAPGTARSTAAAPTGFLACLPSST